MHPSTFAPGSSAFATVQFGAFEAFLGTDGNTLSLGELFFVALKETVVTKRPANVVENQLQRSPAAV